MSTCSVVLHKTSCVGLTNRDRIDDSVITPGFKHKGYSERNDVQEDNIKLERDHGLAAARLDQLQHENARLAVELDSMTHDYEQVKDQSLLQEEDVYETREQLNSLEAIVAEYEAKLAPLAAKNQELESEVDGLEHMLKIAMLREQAVIKSEHQLQMIIAMREAEVSDVHIHSQSDRKKTNDELARFEVLILKMEAVVAECHAEADAKESLVFRLQQDLGESQRQLSKMKTDHMRNIDLLKASNERVETLEKLLSGQPDTAAPEEEVLDKLTDFFGLQLKAKDFQNSQLSQQLDFLSEHIRLLERKCEELEILPELGPLAVGTIRQQKIQVQVCVCVCVCVYACAWHIFQTPRQFLDIHAINDAGSLTPLSMCTAFGG